MRIVTKAMGPIVKEVDPIRCLSKGVLVTKTRVSEDTVVLVSQEAVHLMIDTLSLNIKKRCILKITKDLLTLQRMIDLQ